MAILNFPTNPSTGATAVVGGKTYVWNGAAWIVSASSTNFTAGTITGTTVIVTSTTNSVSSTTGALVVKGGVGISGDLYVGGNIVGLNTGTGIGGGTVDLTTGTFKKLIVNGGVKALSTATGDLTVTGGVGIGGDLWLGGVLYSSGAPVLTTASFSNSAQDGQDIDIVDIGGGVLTFNNISTLQTVTGRGNSTTNVVVFSNTTTSTSTNSGAVLITGGLGVGGRINSESIRIADTVFDSTVTTINNTSSWTTIDNFLFSQYRSAKYLVQIDEGSATNAKCQITELFVLASNAGQVYLTEYANVMSDGVDLGDFDADVRSNGNGDSTVTLYFKPDNNLSITLPLNIKVLRTAMAK